MADVLDLRTDYKTLLDTCSDAELQQLLGKGGYGSVYSAQRGGAALAVKIQTLPDQLLAQFLNEAELTRIASDGDFGPKLVLARNCPITDDMFLGTFVLEKYDTDLQNWWQQYKESESHVQSLCDSNLLARIDRMHSYGIVHGDLFPKNILVKHDRDGYITDAAPSDFGLAVDLTNAKSLQEWKKYYPLEAMAKLLESFYDFEWGVPIESLEIRSLDEPFVAALQIYCSVAPAQKQEKRPRVAYEIEVAKKPKIDFGKPLRLRKSKGAAVGVVNVLNRFALPGFPQGS